MGPTNTSLDLLAMLGLSLTQILYTHIHYIYMHVEQKVFQVFLTLALKLEAIHHYTLISIVLSPALFPGELCHGVSY